MIGVYGATFWLVVAVILLVIESVTVQMVCIWFAAGCLFAMLVAFIGLHFWVQMLVFLVSSLAVLFICRPLVMGKLKEKRQDTNVDLVLGKPGVVLEEIDNLGELGRVSANGLSWSARSVTGEIIPKGTKVIVRYRDGVKLIVEPVPSAAIQPPEEGQTEE